MNAVLDVKTRLIGAAFALAGGIVANDVSDSGKAGTYTSHPELGDDVRAETVEGWEVGKNVYEGLRQFALTDTPAFKDPVLPAGADAAASDPSPLLARLADVVAKAAPGTPLATAADWAKLLAPVVAPVVGAVVGGLK